jgi:SynChlorMet cassette protein ScmC
MKIRTISEKTDNGFSYSLRLADGQCWHLVSSRGLKSWAARFASIMELKADESNTSPRLIFIQMESGKKKFEELVSRQDLLKNNKLPRCGWKAQDFNDCRIWSHGDTEDIVLEINCGKENPEFFAMRLSLYALYQRAQEKGGLPFHAALVEQDGKGILLAAPAETGKSTCCRRFPSQWRVLADDETLVVRNGQKQYFAHPFPTWSNHIMKRSQRTWDVQQNVPLSLIFFLEHGAPDKAFHLGQGEAAALIFNSSEQVFYRNWFCLGQEEARLLHKKAFDNACELARAVPAFMLRLSLNGRFWEEIERAQSSMLKL